MKLTITQLNRKLNDLIIEVSILRSHMQIPIVPATVDNDEVQKIIGVIETTYELQPGSLTIKTQRQPIVEAKQIAVFIASKQTELNQNQLGNAFNIHHSTVAYSCKKVIELYEVDRHLKKRLKSCCTNLGISDDVLNGWMGVKKLSEVISEVKFA